MKTLIFTIKETTEGSRSYVVKFGRKVKARFHAEGVFKNFVYKYSIAASSSGGLYSTVNELNDKGLAYSGRAIKGNVISC